MNGVEVADRAVFPWVVDQELQGGRLQGSRQRRNGGDIDMELDRIGDARNERHPTATTTARTVGADVWVHRTDVDEPLHGIGRDIKEAVLSRRMPPWGAVKGFGHFRNDQSLSQDQIELVTK